MARNPASIDHLGGVIRSDEEIRQLRLRRPATAGSNARTVIDFADHLSEGWQSIGAKIVRDGNWCSMVGALTFNPDMTAADNTASEDFDTLKTHYYASSNIVSFGLGSSATVGRNAPQETLAGGVAIPDLYAPYTDEAGGYSGLILTVPVDSTSSDPAFAGRTIQLVLNKATGGGVALYALGGGTFYPSVTDSFGTLLDGWGIPGGSSVYLQLDGIKYLANTPA